MKIEQQVSLRRFTNWHVGGPAAFFVHIANDDDLREAARFIAEKNLPFFVLGKGSNTLFDDAGFPGIIVHMENRDVHVSGTALVAGSGVFMRPLATKALEHELRGLEYLAGIPGTVGGAVRGNAGIPHHEIKDVLTSVDVFDMQTPDKPLRTMTVAECSFSYRTSIFKQHPEWVVVRATFSLQKGDRAEGERLVMEDHAARLAKQPYNAASAGSSFKNPDWEHGVYSGALIEKAGFKGKKVGGAQVSEKHANFILNTGKATSADIKTLIKDIQETVKKQSGINLETEVVIV